MALLFYTNFFVATFVLGLTHYFTLGTNGPQTYQFGYDTSPSNGDGSARLMREEGRLEDGTVIGRYGYTDPFGVFRVVKYAAGPNGYYAFEDVGGASSSEPLFFKATARQNEETSPEHWKNMTDQIATKFAPPLYHPEAHLANKPTLDEDFQKLVYNAQLVSTNEESSVSSTTTVKPTTSSKPSKNEDTDEDEFRRSSVEEAKKVFFDDEGEKDIFKEVESVRIPAGHKAVQLSEQKKPDYHDSDPQWETKFKAPAGEINILSVPKNNRKENVTVYMETPPTSSVEKQQVHHKNPFSKDFGSVVAKSAKLEERNEKEGPKEVKIRIKLNEPLSPPTVSPPTLLQFDSHSDLKKLTPSSVLTHVDYGKSSHDKSPTKSREEEALPLPSTTTPPETSARPVRIRYAVRARKGEHRRLYGVGINKEREGLYENVGKRKTQTMAHFYTNLASSPFTTSSPLSFVSRGEGKPSTLSPSVLKSLRNNTLLEANHQNYDQLKNAKFYFVGITTPPTTQTTLPYQKETATEAVSETTDVSNSFKPFLLPKPEEAPVLDIQRRNFSYPLPVMTSEYNTSTTSATTTLVTTTTESVTTEQTDTLRLKSQTNDSNGDDGTLPLQWVSKPSNPITVDLNPNPSQNIDSPEIENKRTKQNMVIKVWYRKGEVLVSGPQRIHQKVEKQPKIIRFTPNDFMIANNATDPLNSKFESLSNIGGESKFGAPAPKQRQKEFQSSFIKKIGSSVNVYTPPLDFVWGRSNSLGSFNHKVSESAPVNVYIPPIPTRNTFGRRGHLESEVSLARS